MRPNPTLIPWAFVALMAGGCGSSQTTTRTTPTETPQQRSAASSTDRPGMSGMCPMKVTGTTVWAEDIEGGVALRFTTTGDVAELQSRLQRMAQMHNRQAADRRGRGPHEHGMHGHPEHAMMGGPAMQAKARAENLEDGGRLVFTPRDPEQLADLQQALRTHAEKMSSGRCPMMSKHASAGANEPPAPVANESRDR